MNFRRSNNSREKKKSKKSMKPSEPKPKHPKIKFKHSLSQLGRIVDALEKQRRLGVKEIIIDEEGKKQMIDKEYAPTAIYIQKTDFDYESHLSYDVFLKFPSQGKKTGFTLVRMH
jgi:hypothetical protein